MQKIPVDGEPTRLNPEPGPTNAAAAAEQTSAEVGPYESPYTDTITNSNTHCKPECSD